jgi:pilus assembly protein CpaC
MKHMGPGLLTKCVAALAAVAILFGVSLAASAIVEAAARVVQLSDESRVGKVLVVLGNSETIRIELPFSEIVVGDAETADVSALTNKTLYILGRKLGSTNVTLFDENKQLVAVIDIEVTHNLKGLRQAIGQSTPGSEITVRSVNGRVLLEGTVPSAPAAEKAMAIARDFAGDQVTNALSISASQQVNLEVRFVEINRTAGKELGVSWAFLGSDIGAGTGVGLAIPVAPGAPSACCPGTPSTPGGIGAPALGLGAISGALPFGALVANILGNGVNPDVLITALEQKKLARRLAEPNLTALSGEKASFLAGGEFPVPTDDDDGQSTIEFKPFGVRLDFVPVVLDNGLINLQVQPEVSELDFTNSVRVGNLLVPGLTVRRASTSVELRDGQSFAIAGLLQSVNSKTAEQVPWLGDVPVLGTLFRSSSFQKRESDLVIIVTPRLARPVGTKEQLHDPLQNPLSSNEPEFFLLGKQEVARKDLDLRFHGLYGHIIDLPKVNHGAPQK